MPADPGSSSAKPPSRPEPAKPPAPPSRQAPSTRQQRREAQRRAADPRLAKARTAATRPAWQSPMVLLTAGAVVIGIVVVLLAVLPNLSKGSPANVVPPLQVTPVGLIDPTNSRALGSASAPVKVEVWSDFQCPACKYFDDNAESAFIDKYVKTGKASFLYRDYAFIDKGADGGESHQAAAAARCAGDQGKFWPYHDFLFENQGGENKGTFSAVFLGAIADKVGLDRPKYDACMANGASDKVALVKAETKAGSDLKVNQTPTLSVNGVLQALPNSTAPGGAVSAAQLGAAVDAAMGSATPAPMPSSAP